MITELASFLRSRGWNVVNGEAKENDLPYINVYPNVITTDGTPAVQVSLVCLNGEATAGYNELLMSRLMKELNHDPNLQTVTPGEIHLCEGKYGFEIKPISMMSTVVVPTGDIKNCF